MQSNIESPLIGVGELLWDLLPSGARLGGTTTNFSILSARLGNCVVLISRVGQDELGNEALHRLECVATSDTLPGRLDVSGVQRSATLSTGTVGVSLDQEGRPRYTIEQPVAWDEITSTDDLIRVAAKASCICFGTLAQRQDPSRSSIRALVETTPQDCIRVCDANLRMPFCDAETMHWCLRHATVLKISDEELPEVERLLGIGIGINASVDAETDEERLTRTARESARALLSVAPGCALVAITLGPRGSLLVDRRGEHRHHGFQVAVSDTIGAGDAFTAGLTHSFVRGASLEQISVVSNLCGSYVASQAGATPELPPELLQQIRDVLAAPAPTV